MFCSNCGKKINDDAIFCSNCGKKVITNPNENIEDKIDKKGKKIRIKLSYFIIGIVSIIIIIGTIFIFISNQNDVSQNNNLDNAEIDNTIENLTQNTVNNSSINSVKVPIKDTPMDKEVISCAKSALRSAAQYDPEIGTTTIIDRDNYGRYLISCYAKLVNGFGVGKYQVYYIVLSNLEKKDGTWYYTINRANGIIDSSIYMSEESAIETAKTLNKWNEPSEQDEPEYNEEDDKNIIVDDTAETGATYTFTLEEVKTALKKVCKEKNVEYFSEFTYKNKNKYNEVYEANAYIGDTLACSIRVQIHNGYVVDLSYYRTYYEETEFAKSTGKEVFMDLIDSLFDENISRNIIENLNRLTSNTFTFIRECHTICTNYDNTEIYITTSTNEYYENEKNNNNSAYKELFREI